MKTLSSPSEHSGLSSGFAVTPGSALSHFAAKLLAALQRLTREREQHPCGGFNIDDMRWQMGLVFAPDDTMHEAMDELLNARLILFAGYDENAVYESCYAPLLNIKISHAPHE